MGGMKVEKFGGMLPAWDDRFLPDDQASFSQNTYLYSGAAVGWRQPKLLRQMANSAAKYAFRIPLNARLIANATLSVLAPVAGDTVTVGEITYTFVAAPANPFDVLIGSSPTQSAEALFMALNFGSFDPAVVGANTPLNTQIAVDAPVVGFPYSFSGGTNTPGANTLILVPITPTGTMKISSVSLLPAGSNGSAKFTGLVYENVNQINAAGTAYTNIPSSLAGAGAEVVGCTAGLPVTSVLPVPITLQGGSMYWIGFLMDTAIPLSLASASTAAVSVSQPYTSGPLNPFQITNLSGVTIGGTNFGTLLTPYNTAQPNWVVWGAMTPIGATDPVNTITGSTLVLFAPDLGLAYNLIPVAESTGGARMSWGGQSFFQGGANRSVDTEITGPSYWLEYLDQDTNVVRTPVVDDTFQRYYTASPSRQPEYNTYDRIAAGLPAYKLGVPAPTLPPTVTTAAGGYPITVGLATSTTSASLVVGGSSYEVLYPIMVSAETILTAASLVVLSSAAGGNIVVGLYADGANTLGGTAGKPGDVIQNSSIDGYAAGTNVTATATWATSTEPTLMPNVQYWLSFNVSTTVGDVLALADNDAVGYLVTATGTNPNTGKQTIVSAAPGQPDVQAWGILSPGTTGEPQLETRGYVYTWVTAFGEEGPPSPPTLFDAFDNATWIIGIQPPLADDMGVNRDIVSTNIYRTIPSQSGGTVFFFVGTVAATAATFVDTVTDDVAATNLILPSTNWFPPPATLEGIVSMPNGMLAGFVDNEVWFCEPFRPHAWPAGYVLTTEFPIVGLGVSGVSLVACTETNPNVFTGVKPSAMTQQRLSLIEPCIARGGILGTTVGVYYPSVNGLILVSGSGYMTNATQAWITRENWAKLTPQKFMRAVKNASSYFAFGTTGVTNGQPDASLAKTGFTIELSEVADQQSFTLWPQVGGHRIGFGTLSSPNGLALDNVLCDPWSGVTITVAGGNVYYYDFTDQAPIITKYFWRSKKFQGPHRDNYSAFRVWFDIPPGGPQTPPATRTTVPFSKSPPKTAQLAYAPGMFGVIRIIADGAYVTERELRFSTELMRVASEQKYSTWQVEIEGVVSVTNVKIATSVKELAIGDKKTP